MDDLGVDDCRFGPPLMGGDSWLVRQVAWRTRCAGFAFTAKPGDALGNVRKSFQRAIAGRRGRKARESGQLHGSGPCAPHAARARGGGRTGSRCRHRSQHMRRIRDEAMDLEGSVALAIRASASGRPTSAPDGLGGAADRDPWARRLVHTSRRGLLGEVLGPASVRCTSIAG